MTLVRVSVRALSSVGPLRCTSSASETRVFSRVTGMRPKSIRADLGAKFLQLSNPTPDHPHHQTFHVQLRRLAYPDTTNIETGASCVWPASILVVFGYRQPEKLRRHRPLGLVMGLVRCGGGYSHETKTASSDQPPAQVTDVDPVAALEKLGAKIKRNEQGEIV